MGDKGVCYLENDCVDHRGVCRHCYAEHGNMSDNLQAIDHAPHQTHRTDEQRARKGSCRQEVNNLLGHFRCSNDVLQQDPVFFRCHWWDVGLISRSFGNSQNWGQSLLLDKVSWIPHCQSHLVSQPSPEWHLEGVVKDKKNLAAPVLEVCDFPGKVE